MKSEKLKKFGKYSVSGTGDQTLGNWADDCGQSFKFHKGAWLFSFNGFDPKYPSLQSLAWECWIGNQESDFEFEEKADFCDAIQEILVRQPKPTKFPKKDRTEISKIAQTLKSELKAQQKEVERKGRLLEKVEKLLEKF